MLFRLDADRRSLATTMVASAIVQDLVVISALRQSGEHRPALVLIDEFSAVAATAVVKLFGRARGAKISLLVLTQEFADLQATNANASGDARGILEQVVGNLSAIIAHRQMVPESAELLAGIAGTRPAWITTQQTSPAFGGLQTGMGSRTRGREYVIHPDEFKALRCGEAAVIVPAERVAEIVRVLHPDGRRPTRGGRC